MCLDCNLSDTLLSWKPGLEPPVPTPDQDPDTRFQAISEWWTKVKALDASSCCVCKALHVPHQKPTDSGGPCCGTCGGGFENETYTLDQRKHGIMGDCYHVGSRCEDHRNKLIRVPFVCDACWLMLQPCKVESFDKRENLYCHEIITKHQFTHYDQIQDYLRGCSLFKGRKLHIPSIFSLVDYDKAFLYYKMKGPKFVPTSDSSRHGVAIRDTAHAAELFCQRVFLRLHSSFPELVEKRLAEKKDQYEQRVQATEEYSREESEVKKSIDAEMRGMIVEAEKEALGAVGGYPDDWPWAKRLKRKRSEEAFFDGGYDSMDEMIRREKEEEEEDDEDEDNEEEEDEDEKEGKAGSKDEKSVTSYLSDRHPFSPLLQDRIDSDDIEWYTYEKCRGGCYRQHRYNGKHDCAGRCQLIFCPDCAKEIGGQACEGDECNRWVCTPCGDKAQQKSGKRFCSGCIRSESSASRPQNA